LLIVYKKRLFELQPEDGFIKKPKHVGNTIFSLFFNYISYNKGRVRIKSYINFISSSELLLRLIFPSLTLHLLIQKDSVSNSEASCADWHFPWGSSVSQTNSEIFPLVRPWWLYLSLSQ